MSLKNGVAGSTLFSLIFSFALGGSAAWAAPTNPVLIPPDLTGLADGIKKEKSRLKRLELFAALSADVKKKVNDLSDNISESEIARVQTLYELNLLLGSVKVESLNPASCGETQRLVKAWANPKQSPDSELSETSRFVVDVVRSVCAP